MRSDAETRDPALDADTVLDADLHRQPSPSSKAAVGREKAC